MTILIKKVFSDEKFKFSAFWGSRDRRFFYGGISLRHGEY